MISGTKVDINFYITKKKLKNRMKNKCQSFISEVHIALCQVPCQFIMKAMNGCEKMSFDKFFLGIVVHF